MPGPRAPSNILTAAALREALSGSDVDAMIHARAEVLARPIRYPLGSAQAEEIALAAGLRPMFRQLLSRSDLERAVARFEAAGLYTAVAPRVYGPTHEGWDDTVEPLPAEAPGARRALFVGRDPKALEAAVACDLSKSDESHRELGRLLGYPRCCVEAFVVASEDRRNTELHQAAWAKTDGVPFPRLNVLDLGVFHYVSWMPCTFRCPYARAWADAVAERIGKREPAFVRDIDRALAAHRLVLTDEVQLSLRGPYVREAGPGVGGITEPLEVWPTARDRHPSASLEPEIAEAVAWALTRVRSARRVGVHNGWLRLDDREIPGTWGAMLLPFGAQASGQSTPT